MADKNSTLPELRSEFAQKSAAVDDLLAKAPDTGLSESDSEQLDRLEKDLNEIQKRLGDADKLEEARNRQKARNANTQEPVHRPGQGRGEDRNSKSLGEKVSEDLKEFVASLKSRDGNIKPEKRVESPGVAVESLLKTLVTGASDTSAGAFVRNDRSPVVTNRSPFRQLTMRDIITLGETESDAVEYAVITGYTNNAAPVAEATATFGNSGMPAESAFATNLETANVRDISHYVPISKRGLADAGQVKTIVDNLLMFGVEDTLENQMLNGDGTGQNLLGIFNNNAIQSQAYVENILTTIRKARTKCKTPGRVSPNAILMHPEDWELFDLTQDGEQRYRFGGPAEIGNPRLWGVPVIENEAVPVGTALMGDFRYATLWDRMAAEITMSDSPENFFLRKLVAVMASLRAAFGVLYPKAFVEIALTDPDA